MKESKIKTDAGHICYRGHVVDRLNNRNTVALTRWYKTYEEAQRRAEALCKRKFGAMNERYAVTVE